MGIATDETEGLSEQRRKHGAHETRNLSSHIPTTYATGDSHATSDAEQPKPLKLWPKPEGRPFSSPSSDLTIVTVVMANVLNNVDVNNHKFADVSNTANRGVQNREKYSQHDDSQG